MSPISSLDAVRAAVTNLSVESNEVNKGLGRGVVTISRDAGTDAGEVATMLAEKLNARFVPTAGSGARQWMAYDRELLTLVADQHDLTASIVEKMDEREIGFVESLVSNFSSQPSGGEYAMSVSKTIRGLAAAGRAIIVGRGAQVVLHGVRHVFHVRLTGSLEWRTSNYARKHGVSESDAKAAIVELDEQRRDYVKAFKNHDADDIKLYDLVINAARISNDDIADIIVTAVSELQLDG